MSNARKIVDECVEFYARWGRLADESLPYKASELIDAMIALEEEKDADYLSHREELTLARRQLTAAKAREGKQKKQIERLQAAIAEITLTWQDEDFTLADVYEKHGLRLS